MDVQNIILLDTMKKWHCIVDKLLYTPNRRFFHVFSKEQCLERIEKESIALLVYDVLEDVNTSGLSAFLQEIECAGKIMPIIFFVERGVTVSYKYALSSTIEKPLHSVVLRSIVQEMLV